MQILDFALFTERDIPEFLALAAAEGWISGAWELEFLLSAFPPGCLVCRACGAPVAFITTVKYGRSGWVGNLIVRNEWRGKGVGSELMGRGMAALSAAGTRTVWLTASASGRPIYERLGFSAVDTVVRWQGSGTLAPGNQPARAEEIAALDAAGWGDSRVSLLRAVSRRGPAVYSPKGFLVCQQWEDAVQLGPWGCANPEAAALLLDRALVPSGSGSRLFLDVPELNRAARCLLVSRGFAPVSSTTLMSLGDKPAYAARLIYSLASMGSMG